MAPRDGRPARGSAAGSATAEAKDSNDDARGAWELLWDFGTRLRTHVTSIAADLELTPMQMLALKRIGPGAAVPMNALADMLICDASNVTGIVDKLEARGLIQRRPDDRDRRVKMLVLTEAGAKLRRRCVARMLEPPPPIAALPPAEQRRLAVTLRELLDRWPAAADACQRD